MSTRWLAEQFLEQKLTSKSKIATPDRGALLLVAKCPVSVTFITFCFVKLELHTLLIICARATVEWLADLSHVGWIRVSIMLDEFGWASFPAVFSEVTKCSECSSKELYHLSLRVKDKYNCVYLRHFALNSPTRTHTHLRLSAALCLEVFFFFLQSQWLKWLWERQRYIYTL